MIFPMGFQHPLPKKITNKHRGYRNPPKIPPFTVGGFGFAEDFQVEIQLSSSTDDSLTEDCGMVFSGDVPVFGRKCDAVDGSEFLHQLGCIKDGK